MERMFKYSLMAFAYCATVSSSITSTNLQEQSLMVDIRPGLTGEGERAITKNLVQPIIVRAQELAHEHAANKHLPIPVVAIAGCSAVGKTSFTKQLAKLLKQEEIKVAIFNLDDFLQPTPVFNALLHPYLDHLRLHEVIQKVIAGQEHIQKPIWDRTGLKSVKEEVVACFHDIDLILFEGIYTLCGSETYDLLKYSSYRIFIEAPEDQIMQWNRDRESLKCRKSRTQEKFESDVAWDMKDYREIILPSKNNADIVIKKAAGHMFLETQIIKR